MKRGDLITVALRGSYGKPRPAVIIQSDRLSKRSSVLVCPLTSHVEDAIALRPVIKASPGTGLRMRSQIMVDKIAVVERHQCGERIGALDPALLAQLNASLAFVIGLAEEVDEAASAR